MYQNGLNREDDVKYDCVVLVKQVPDTKAVTSEAMKEDGTVNRAALPAIFNPEDLNALEEALKVKDKFGGTVTVITMGPPQACEVLREAYYRGADRCIIISDRRAAASDTLATSYILSCAIKKLPRFDIVFCGRQAIDGDTAQVGPQTAEKLGIPQITYLEELVSLEDGKIIVRRNVGNGWELVQSRLPVLITVVAEANIPRPGKAHRIMKYKKSRAKLELVREIAGENDDPNDPKIQKKVEDVCKKLEEKGLIIEHWTLDDIGADLTWCGREGSPTKVHRIQAVVLKGTGHKQYPPTEDGVRELVHELIEERTLG